MRAEVVVWFLALTMAAISFAAEATDEHLEEISPPTREENPGPYEAQKKFLTDYFPLDDFLADKFSKQIWQDDEAAGRALGELIGSIPRSARRAVRDAAAESLGQLKEEDKTGKLGRFYQLIRAAAHRDVEGKHLEDAELALSTSFKDTFDTAREAKREKSKKYNSLVTDLIAHPEKRDEVQNSLASLGFSREVLFRHGTSSFAVAHDLSSAGESLYVAGRANGDFIWLDGIDSANLPHRFFVGYRNRPDLRLPSQWLSEALARGTTGGVPSLREGLRFSRVASSSARKWRIKRPIYTDPPTLEEGMPEGLSTYLASKDT